MFSSVSNICSYCTKSFGKNTVTMLPYCSGHTDIDGTENYEIVGNA